MKVLITNEKKKTSIVEVYCGGRKIIPVGEIAGEGYSLVKLNGWDKQQIECLAVILHNI